MASHHVIEGYVEELSVRLPVGPRHWRAAVLDEVRDCLLEGLDAHSGAGQDPTTAALRAVGEHGTAEQIARLYAPELAVLWARRAAALALGTIPAMAIVWNVALRVGPPSTWRPTGAGLTLASTVIAAGVCLTLVCSGAVLLATRRPRTVAERRPTLRIAVSAASATVCTPVLAVIGVVAARALAAPGTLEWPAVLGALVVSAVALTSVGRSTRRCITSLRTAR